MTTAATRAAGRRPQVLLINPPNTSDVAGIVATVTRSQDLTDWANVPNLGILTLASAVADIPGITPVYMDGTVVAGADILRYAEDNAASLLAVGMSMLTASYAAGLDLLRALKRIKPEVVTVVGNDHFTALPALCLHNQRDCIDYGFAGNEVVGPFRALIADLASGTVRGPHAYPGLAAWTDAGLVRAAQRPEPVYTGQRPALIDAVFAHGRQYRANFLRRVGPRLGELLGVRLHAGLPVEIARGCIKFSRDDACSFCSIQYGGMWRNAVDGPASAWQLIGKAVRAGYDYLSVTADELPLTFGSLLRQMRDRPPAWWRALPAQDRPLLAGYARADGLSDPRHAAMLRELNIRYLMVGLDAGSPLSLAALNKPLSPARGGDPGYRAERMFEHNLAALEVARNEGLLLKAGFVVGHIGMTSELLAANVDAIRALIDKGKGAIASVDIEVLSPEPGSLDYRYLTEPGLASAAAERLGVVIGDHGTRAEIARAHARLDVSDRESAMRDHVRALMPGLQFADLAAARAQVRAHCRQAGVVIGE
jgi:anaerobic magnesium-protoporphyrin IX monomethyl ester cyclase